jgi:hypothetical protein
VARLQKPVSNKTLKNNKDHMERKLPFHQNLIKWAAYLFGGIFFLGTVLDAISNSITLITPRRALVYTFVILLIWGAIEFAIRKKLISWVVSEGQKISISSLGISYRLGFVGMVLLLWIPQTCNEIPREISDMNRTASGDTELPRIVAGRDVIINSMPPPITLELEQPIPKAIYDTETHMWTQNLTIKPNRLGTVPNVLIEVEFDKEYQIGSYKVIPKDVTMPLILQEAFGTIGIENSRYFKMGLMELPRNTSIELTFRSNSRIEPKRLILSPFKK